MAGNDKIDILITRFLSGEALPEEAMELEDWMNASPENKSYFKEYSVLFETTVEISSDDKDRAWKNLTQSKLIHWRWVGIAASVALIVALGWLIIRSGKNQPGSIVHKADAIAKMVVLKDSSEVIVSPNSSISIDKEYGVRNRKITLKGSAVFSVIHNPSQPVIVDVNAFHIQDLGTKFSVVTTPASDTIFITVAEGKIAAYDDFGASENAGAGEKLFYIQSKRKIVNFPKKRDTVGAAPPQMPQQKEAKRMVVKEPLSKPRPDSGIAKHYTIPDNPDSVRRFITEIRKDSTPSQRIVTDLVRDGLIVRGEPLRFRISDTAFILNGVRQPDSIFTRYRDKYGGIPVPAGWSWGHGENNP